jgi:hypothetical protein
MRNSVARRGANGDSHVRGTVHGNLVTRVEHRGAARQDLGHGRRENHVPRGQEQREVEVGGGEDPFVEQNDTGAHGNPEGNVEGRVQAGLSGSGRGSAAGLELALILGLLVLRDGRHGAGSGRDGEVSSAVRGVRWQQAHGGDVVHGVGGGEESWENGWELLGRSRNQRKRGRRTAGQARAELKGGAALPDYESPGWFGWVYRLVGRASGERGREHGAGACCVGEGAPVDRDPSGFQSVLTPVQFKSACVTTIGRAAIAAN